MNNTSQFPFIQGIDDREDANENLKQFRKDVLRELAEIRLITHNNDNLASTPVAQVVQKNTAGTGVTIVSTRLDENGAYNGRGETTISVTPGTYAPFTHSLLSSTHADTTAASVVRGDIITGQGATPKWTRLAKGSLNQALLMGADEPAWTALTPALSGAASGTGTLNCLPKVTNATGPVYGDSLINEVSSKIGINVASPSELLSVAGRLALVETTAPTSTSGYGKYWVSSTNYMPYFMDRNGKAWFGYGGHNPGSSTIAGPYAGNTTMTFASAIQSTFYGIYSGAMITTGSLNTLYGYSTGRKLTTTSANSFFGRQAGEFSTSGSGTFIGGRAGYQCGSNYATAIGYYALGGGASSAAFTSVADNGSGKCRFTTSTYHNLGSSYSVYIDGSVYKGTYTATVVSGNTFDCTSLAYTTTDSGTIYHLMSGNYMTAIGSYAGQAALPTATENFYGGYNAGLVSRSSYSTYIGGYHAGSCTYGSSNVGIGSYVFGGYMSTLSLSITSVADNGSGQPRFTFTKSYFNPVDSRYVRISGTAYYDGWHQVSNVTNTTFDVAALSYVATTTGTIYMQCESGTSVAIGNSAMSRTLAGDYTVAIGASAGAFSFSGDYRTFVGNDAGRYNQGEYPTCIGAQAGTGGSYYTISSVADNGSGKPRFTTSSAHYITDGQTIYILNNTVYAGIWTATVISPTQFDITSLTYTTSGGTGTVYRIASSNYQIALGYNSGAGEYGSSYSIAISPYTHTRCAGNGNIAIGYGSQPYVTNTGYCVAIGTEAQGGYYNSNSGNVYFTSVSDNGSGKCRFTTSAAHYLSDGQYVTISSSIYGGNAYQVTVIDSTRFDITSLTYSVTGVGYVYGYMSGDYNASVGRRSLYKISSGSGNTSIGNESGYSLKNGSFNVYVGRSAGYSAISADRNVFVGPYAGYYETASNTLMIDNLQRSSESDARTKALLYGIFDASTDNQYLRVNGHLELPERAAPTATSGYQKFWASSSDNLPHHLSSGGTDRNIVLSSAAVNSVPRVSTVGILSAGKITDTGIIVTIGDGTNQTKIASDGTLTLEGTATAWDDLVFSAHAAKKGALDKPDWDDTNVGLLFPQNDTSEYVQIICQMPHRWKAGSDIYPHVHYQRTSAGKPTFKIAYCWINIGDATATPTTVVELGTEVVTYTSGTIHQINKSAAAISGSGKTMSSILLIKLYRDDNTLAPSADSLVYQFDIHYEVDSFGSSSEYTK